MNCWKILGIEPTRDRAAIDQAYEQQRKFATGEDLSRLEQAYREATGEAPAAEKSAGSTEEPASALAPASSHAELSAEEQQIVREVVIQIKALLNDSRRSADEGIWRAILTEPPADRPALRSAIADSLAPQIRPMAENGSFPAPVVAFLGNWFDWEGLRNGPRPAFATEPSGPVSQGEHRDYQEDTQPPVTNFWPAVIGWVVALAVLAAFFEGIFGG